MHQHLCPAFYVWSEISKRFQIARLDDLMSGKMQCESIQLARYDDLISRTCDMSQHK